MMSGDTETAIFPAFERLRYFHGQMLGARDFRAEQDYFREKIKLLTRCLDGHGVVCGLDVARKEEPDDCDPADAQKRRELEAQLEALTAGDTSDDPEHDPDDVRARIEEIHRILAHLPPARPVVQSTSMLTITPGMAIDCLGNTVLLGVPIDIDPRAKLDGPESRRVDAGEIEYLYISVCYCERAIEPTRPVVSHSCATAESCEHARIQESISVVVSVDPPADDESCDPCCCPCPGDCGAACVLLARVEVVCEGDTVELGTVHNDVRRPFGRHRLTTIVGVNWWHGARYDVADATGLARTGFTMKLSGPVRTDTLRPGVIDVLVYQGGKGNVGGIYYVTGALEVPAGKWTNEIVWCSDSDETFQNGDRVLLRLRGDFVVDECCRPIDADHLGGRVPPLEGAFEPQGHDPYESCLSPTDRSGPWRSGNGAPGGVFESWLYVTNEAGETR